MIKGLHLEINKVRGQERPHQYYFQNSPLDVQFKRNSVFYIFFAFMGIEAKNIDDQELFFIFLTIWLQNLTFKKRFFKPYSQVQLQSQLGWKLR